jgi:hypothetical protein
VLLLVDNLFWSARWVRSLRALGHEAVVVASAGKAPAWIPGGPAEADVAIVNLAATRLPLEDWLPALRALGVRTIGHAGHKEKDLLQRGREAGCDLVVTNGEITRRLPEVLARALGTL